MTRLRNLYIGLTLLCFLSGCAAALPIQVREYNRIGFSPSKKIFLESGDEVVALSSRLKSELTRAGFRMEDARKDAEYILSFHYNARFDVYPWVFTSFDLHMAHSESGDVIYRIESGKSGKEPTGSALKRIADDMASRLLKNPKKGQVVLIVDGTKDRQ